MKALPTFSRRLMLGPVFVAILGLATVPVEGQDRLPKMPGYEQYQKMSREIPSSVRPGTLSVTWKDGGKALDYRLDGKLFHHDLTTGKVETKAAEGKDAGTPAGKKGKGFGQRGGGGGGGQPPGGIARGRQAGSATAPDGSLRAFYKDRNLWLADGKGVLEMPITTDGSEKARIKNGIASWVYGEELEQRTAMWWSPDSKKIAYYRFDESQVPDYYLALGQTSLQTRVDAEPYPKAGTPNPIVDLFVYDVATKKTVRVDVRDGKPFENSAVGYYAYNVRWSRDGKELLFNRTNRRQNIMELTACDPATGKCRVVVREEWPPSWVENSPPLRYLSDNHRFLWISERNGFKNLYLYDLSGKLHATVTNHPFEVANIVRVDEANGLLWYMARSGDNPMKLQLHRVGLDGKGDQRLTDPAFHHTVDLAPDGKHFLDVYQTHNTPAATRLVSNEGKVLAELAKADTTRFDQLGLKRVELFQFKAADGTTDLHGLLHFPSNFDPSKQYPLLVSVYAGPATNGARETFTLPNAMTEYGFLVATLDARSAGGRGKRFLDSIYLKLGVTEIDDLAAGVKSLWSRPYLAKERVGIFGGSYGGYASAMCLLRHPDTFSAACASSPVTDWRLYDTIYTERYMWIPQENKEGYDTGNAMTYADKLTGRLMLFFGTSDNNVHPSNTMQLVRALQRAGKSFDLQLGPDQGHTSLGQPRMMEFFIENLVLRK